MKYFNRSGFTLTELLVVMAVMGVMATIVVALINPVTQQQRAYDARRKSDLSQIQKALELYYNDYGQYPASGTFTFGSAWGTYMSNVPNDPTSSTKTYFYWVNTSNYQSYALYAALDISTDPQKCNPPTTCPNITTRLTGTECTVACNYGISSPNTTP